MTLHGLALLCVMFGLLLATLDLGLAALTPFLLGRLRTFAPSRRATAILMVRFAPVLSAVALTLLVVVPSWWRFEPVETGETASMALLAFAGLALLPVLQGLYRGARMFVKTRDRLLLWRGRGRHAACVQAPFEVVEVKSADLALCVGGYLQPTIYASTDVITLLEPEEFSAALAHEISHANARDPLRLLWMGSCPDYLQLFRLDHPWRRAFSTACEFAADAGASRGNPEVALDLASALLKVARLRSFKPLTAEALADVAVSSAFSSRVELEARVEALADPPEAFSSASRLHPWVFAAALLALCAASTFAYESVHALTEDVGWFLS